MSLRTAARGEDGQIIPALVVVLLVALALGLMMLQVGLASDYKSRAQTGADAAALAGAIEVKHQIEAAWARDQQLLPEQIEMGSVCAAAQRYAQRNRAHVERCWHETGSYDVLVEVRGNDKLKDIGDTDEVAGDSAEAKARATPWGFGGAPGAAPGGGGLPIGGGGGGSLMGANPALQVYVDAAAKFGLVVTSGLRPGDTDSYHGSGNAVDLAAPMTPQGKAAMLAFAQYAAQHWGAQLEELIHTPLGYGIKNGVKVAPYAAAEHYNHVHIADTDPPKPGQDSGPPRSGGPVGPGPSGGLGGLGAGGGLFGGMGLQVHLVRWDGTEGRAPEIPGIPPDVPGSLRQVMFNVMMCESGGNPRAIEPPGGNGGPLGHYGLFQFDIPTWESVGGHGNPIDASPEEQWMRAIMLYQRRGFQPWECADARHLGYV